MSQGVTITRKFHIKPGFKGRKRMQAGESPAVLPMGRVPRVSRIMALAIHLDQLVQQDKVESQAELARLGQVTRARLSQIFLLLSLAPDIQEQILFLPLIERGKEPVQERQLRQVALELDWDEQREMWKSLVDPQTKT